MEKYDRSLSIVEDKARNIRIDAGLTQKEFGNILGISKSYLSDMENGYKGLSIEYINKICNYADVSFDFMFNFTNIVDKDIIKIEKINLKLLINIGTSLFILISLIVKLLLSSKIFILKASLLPEVCILT